MEEQKPKFEMTAEEFDKIGKALKNEDFRKLLVEYAEEISDPVNRERYEKEIAELERERGSDVTFLHPKPGFVIKTHSDEEKTKKVFINICHAPQIQMATATRAQDSSGAEGQNWSIPYSISAAREDLDKSKKRCTVYDVLFNEGTLDLGKQNPRFRQLIIDTAMEGLAKDLDVHVQVKDIRELKVAKYFGKPQSSVLRKPGSKGAAGAGSATPSDDFSKKLESMYPYNQSPGLSASSSSAAAASEDGRSRDSKPASSPSSSEATSTPVRETGAQPCATVDSSASSEPTYKIVQRGIFDIQDFRMSRDSAPGCWPKQLVVTISLPRCRNMSGVDLEVLSKEIILVIDNLDVDMEISLPYAVNEENGAATFDKSQRQLIVTLNVLPPPTPSPFRTASPPPMQTASAPSSSMPVLDVRDDDEDRASAPEHKTDAEVEKAEASISAAPSDEVGHVHTCQLEDGGATGVSSVTGNSDLIDPDPRLPIPDTEVPITDTDVYALSPVLPEFELSQSLSEISVFWYVDSPTDWRVHETEQKIIMDWNASSTATHHRAVLAGSRDERFSLTTASCMPSGILVLLAKKEHCRRLWRTLGIGTSSNSLQVVTFKQARQGSLDSDVAAAQKEGMDTSVAGIIGTLSDSVTSQGASLSQCSAAAESVAVQLAASSVTTAAVPQGEQNSHDAQAGINSPARVEQVTQPVIKLDDLSHPLLFAID